MTCVVVVPYMADDDDIDYGIRATLDYIQTHLEEQGEEVYDIDPEDRIQLLNLLNSNHEAIREAAEDYRDH